jgi:2-polyprenyl-3-methyl-5-hydroxy-6-metoxy-1,4-benzoquinol methylase
VGRTGYFATNAILGTVGFELHEALVVGKNENEPDRPPLIPRNGKVATRLLLEAALSYQQDYARIAQAMYKAPWDMMMDSSNSNKNGSRSMKQRQRHRQSSPIHVATQSARFVQEAIGTLGRRKRATPNDKQVWMFESDEHDTKDNTNDESSSIYPEYYRTAFHYQTDGWMSTRSAQVYETSTESLFLGRQDAMQRTALPALMRAARDFSKRTPLLLEQSRRPMRVLEVACGTGRFLTFVRDNLPPDTEYTAVDLSPYYLEAARENDAYWRTFTKKETVGTKSNKPATFLQARAEDLRPLKDESFDAVVCLYLFH